MIYRPKMWLFCFLGTRHTNQPSLWCIYEQLGTMILPLRLIFFEQRDPFHYYTSYFKYCTITWVKKCHSHFCHLCWNPGVEPEPNHKSFFAQQQSRNIGNTRAGGGKKQETREITGSFYIHYIFEHTTGRGNENLARRMPKPLFSCQLFGSSRRHWFLVLLPAAASLMWNSVHDYLRVNGRQIERKKRLN